MGEEPQGRLAAVGVDGYLLRLVIVNVQQSTYLLLMLVVVNPALNDVPDVDLLGVTEVPHDTSGLELVVYGRPITSSLQYV